MQGDKFSCLALKSCRWTHIYGSTAHFFVCSVVGCKYNLFVPKTRKIVGKYNISVAAAIIFVSYAYFIDMEFFCMNLQFLCSQLYGGRQIAVGCSRSFVAPVDVFSQCRSKLPTYLYVYAGSFKKEQKLLTIYLCAKEKKSETVRREDVKFLWLLGNRTVRP